MSELKGRTSDSGELNTVLYKQTWNKKIVATNKHTGLHKRSWKMSRGRLKNIERFHTNVETQSSPTSPPVT